MLRSLVSRIASFREYSVFFVSDATTHECFVHTWDDDSLFAVCVRVESAGQHVPVAELAGLSRIVDSVPSCQLPLSCQGGSVSFLRVLNDNRVDGRQFLFVENLARMTSFVITGRQSKRSSVDWMHRQ